MNECIVITRFTRSQPGFLDFAYRIRALSSNHRLTVVSYYPMNHNELKVAGVEYLVLATGESRLQWLLYLYKCVRLIRTRRPACVALLHTMAAPVALFAGKTPTALYWNEHPTHFLNPPANASLIWRTLLDALISLIFKSANRASVIMPIGEAHRDDLVAHGCDPRRLRLIYMGVDASFSRVAIARNENQINSAPLRLIYIGSVSKARGRDVMLEAMATVNKEWLVAKLTIVGADEREIVYCKERARELGIETAVTIVGRVAGQEIPNFLSHADAGICIWEDLPWWRFNPPTKLFEYLVAGLPVLASDIRTHTQYIHDGQNGMIFKYGSAGLANAILELFLRRKELSAFKLRAFNSGQQYLWHKLEPTFLDTIAKLERASKRSVKSDLKEVT